MENAKIKKISRVGILGAGNAGQAFAGWLASRGCEVRITDLFPEPVNRLSGVKAIELLGMIKCNGPVQVVTDPAKCVENADLIILATAAPGHRAMMEKSASGLRDGQILMVQPAYWAHRTIPHYLKQLGVRRRLIHVQTESLIYTCRSVEPGKVMINYVKNGMGCAVQPSGQTESILGLLKEFWPQLHARTNALEVSLDNINFTLHPTIMLLNASRIEEENAHWFFYRQGVSNGVVKLVGRIDEERLACGKALGLTLTPTYELLKKYYSVPGAHDLLTQISLNPAYEQVAAPTTLNYRYFQEDIPFGLVPMLRLAESAGVKMPLTDSVIQLASALVERDSIQIGLALDDFGPEADNE